MIEYLNLDRAAAICGLSERTLRRGMRDPRRPLRHIRKGRRILIRRDHLDDWLEADLVAAVPAGMSSAAEELFRAVVGTRGALDHSELHESPATARPDCLIPTQVEAENRAGASRG